jgi:hypothetical protein
MSIGTARDLLGDSIVKLVITNGVEVANVTHLVVGPRWPSASRCCGARRVARSTIGIQADHRVPWADDQVTELADLDPLCSHQHRLKSHHAWALIASVGKRPMDPPGDPRHPANQATGPARDASAGDRSDGAGEACRPEGTTPPPDGPPRESILFGDVA